jgi:predicted nuclease of restriction endonuclease-like (RecB) superfamily
MDFESLVKHISTIQNTLQAQAAHAVNLALTSRNWLMGCYIVEFEQNGEDRAAYGEQLLKKLEQRLNTKGLNERRFREFRRLYLIYPQLKEPIAQYITSQIQIRRLATAESENGILKLSTEHTQTETWMIPADRLFNKLSSTHLNTISGIDNPVKRAFYEMEAIRGCWSVKELERQIASLYYERNGLSKNKEALSALVQQQATQLQPKDVINTPITLEFLGLNEHALVTENDLEQSILDNLQHFLLEMGHGFCFEARQKRILIDEDYFFADLVFYHRILKCHVIVELKIDKFRHEYASQLNMYLNYFKAEVMQSDDNPPVGILLCTEKGDTLVKYATAGLDPNIFVQKYMIELPSEKEIKEFITSVNCQ